YVVVLQSVGLGLPRLKNRAATPIIQRWQHWSRTITPKALALITVAAGCLLAGCVAAVIGNAPSSGTAGDTRARGEAASDAALASAARARLGADMQLRHAPITVSATAGTVTLRGKVASAAQRVAAERAVRSVDGVSAVNNQLEVN